PGFWPDARQPIGHRWNDAAAVFLDVLFGYVARRHDLSIAVLNRNAEHSLRLKHPLRVMSQRAMPEVTESLLGGIEPVVQGLIVLNFAAEATHGGLRMEECMCHMPSCSVV